MSEDDYTRFRSASLESGGLSDFFSKRHRAGSISGRLRTASDLEERGVIDRATKGLLKDRIITGDPALQSALDKYDRGDASDLEAILKRGDLGRGQSVDLLDGLDLDFLNFSKGGIFQNFDDVDIGFDNLDDFGGYRMRGMSEIDGIMSHPMGDDEPQMTSGQRPPAGSFDSSDLFATFQSGHGQLKSDQDAGGFSAAGQYSGYNGDLYGPPPTSRERDTFGSSQLGTSPLQYTGLDERAITRHKMASSSSGTARLAATSHPQGSYMLAGQQMGYGTAPYGSAGGSVYGESQAMGYNLSAGMPNSALGCPPTSATNPGPLPYKDRPEFVLPPPTAKGEKGYIGAYSPESRKERIERFVEKRKKRVWTKKVKYDVRKNFADSRLRVKGRFVKKEDEEVLRDLMTIQP